LFEIVRFEILVFAIKLTDTKRHEGRKSSLHVCIRAIEFYLNG